MNGKHRKKLIEVALPLEAINRASVKEKSNPFLKGHPRSLHQWWARRPLAAARAVIFSQMVDDPSEYLDVLRSDSKQVRKAKSTLKLRRNKWKETAKYAERMGTDTQSRGAEPTLDDILAEMERQRLFEIIEELVKWENSNNEEVLRQAREEIWQSWRRTCACYADHPQANEQFDRHELPTFHDPFAGGGALPLEAQRLGLEAFASDLNPVPVVINKAMIEIPPKFDGMPPVNPESRDGQLGTKTWCGAQGLAEDVRYYSRWMRGEVEKRIGRYYPKVTLTADVANGRSDLRSLVGRELVVTNCLWARTVSSPNPAFAHVHVPLASSFMLSNRKGSEAWIEPVVANDDYRFEVRLGKPPDPKASRRGTKSGGSGSSFVCLVSGVPMTFDYLRAEGKAKRMGLRLMAMVAEGPKGRVYLPPTPEIEAIALEPFLDDLSAEKLPPKALGFRVQEYGMTEWRDLFAPRQLLALTTVADLIKDLVDIVRADAVDTGVEDAQCTKLCDGGTGALAYGEAVAQMMVLMLSKLADYNNSICTWNPTNQNVGHLFTKHAIPMAWDFPESSPIEGGLSVSALAEGIAKSIESLPAHPPGSAFQHDCAKPLELDRKPVISTDPPYYDNIGYADLSDFFYVWHRRALRDLLPDLFRTIVVPKTEELIAAPFRHGGKASAEDYFLGGMTEAMRRLSEQAHPGFPVTIYYAFKQSERDGNMGVASTGWETFLEAVITAGFAISGTWPIRTERQARAIGIGTNALASSIILVCRPRAQGTPATTRREFVTALQRELPEALRHLQAGNIAPVDLAQASIGPGMAVYTRFKEVLDAQGKPLSVRQALALINETLDSALAEQEGDFDPDSRWALTWFEQFGFDENDYGEAEKLSKAKNTSVQGLEDAGILKKGRGRVRLLNPEELPDDWDPVTDSRLTVWEMVHHLIRVLEAGGESAAAGLVAKLGTQAETARELAYRLYTLCERKKRATEAQAYNALVQSWPEIVRLAAEQGQVTMEQAELL